MPSIVFDSDREPDPIEPQPLQFEGGDLKIALDLDPSSDFLLHSELLVELSACFNGSKANWTQNAKVIQRPATAEELREKPAELTKDKKIVTYYLVPTPDSVYMLDTTASSTCPVLLVSFLTDDAATSKQRFRRGDPPLPLRSPYLCLRLGEWFHAARPRF